MDGWIHDSIGPNFELSFRTEYESQANEFVVAEQIRIVEENSGNLEVTYRK